ncbi:MAG: hypothetical protein QF563_08200 [Candidatus Marinimicrobia bacterium]|nr:hypothetical protein [Candidatus Neomarinimicrobiota bacterium]
MKSISILLIPLFLFLMIGCENNVTNPAGMSDAELIQAIISASKVDISMTELPDQSQTIVENDYNDYDGLGAKKASGLGYEVELAGRGHRFGDRNEVYFNLEGKKLDPDDYGRDKDDWYTDHKDGWKCFDLVLPITFVMPDGSTAIVEDEDDYTAVKSWYENNPGSEEKPNLQYPVQASFQDVTLTINDHDEMREAYERCGGRDGKDRDWERRDCFGLVYPVTYVMPDGSTATVTSDDEAGWAGVKDWYEANPGTGERPELQYPVDIIYETNEGDETVTINNEEEMNAAKRDCWDEDEGGERECFELVLPVTFVMPDGAVITVENEDGYTALREWYVANPDSEEEPVLQYPVNIVYYNEDGEEGTIVTINNEEEMEAAKAECEDGEGRP